MIIKSASDSLKIFSSTIEGTFNSDKNDAFLKFKNKYGEGSAKAFQLFPGLETLTFNIESKQEIVIENLYHNKDCLHFLFCAEGTLSYITGKKRTINRLQNVILESFKEHSNTIVIDKNTHAKFSIITVVKVDTETLESNKNSELSKLLEKVLANLNGKNEYTYFGEIANQVTAKVEKLITTNLTGLANRLTCEAAVFEILSHQYTAHNTDLETLENPNPLSKNDTLKIIYLSEFITKNLHEEISLDLLSTNSGLSKKKIQKGFQFFFKETVNKFISNLRITKAKELLENSDDTISEIVYKIGLSSRSYFSKIFYNKYGLQPKEFRKYHHLSNPTFEISYVSETENKISELEIQKIFSAAKKNNKSLGITGCLMHSNQKFYQILEGPKKEVLQLIEKIKKDSRNKNLVILYSGVKSGRTFSDWNMSLIQKETKGINKNSANSYAHIIPLDLSLTPAAIKNMWEKARNFLLTQQQISV